MDDPEFWKECWDFIKSIFSELSASGVIRAFPGIGKYVSPMFQWLRECILAIGKTFAKLVVCEARRVKAMARDPFGAAFIVLMTATSTFGLWELEIGQGLTMLGWMAFAICVAWASAKAGVRKVRAKLNI